MKKLLGLGVLGLLLVLSACGGSDETVCTWRALGQDMTITVVSENGVVTSTISEIRIDISGLGSDLIAEMVEAEGGTVEGDEIVVSETDTSSAGENLDDFIAGMEIFGATCD